MQRYKNISEDFLNFDLQSFIEANTGADISKLLLSNRGKFSFDFSLLAGQLELYPRARHKLPSFTGAWCFFTRKSYEQSSSEVMARYKASLAKGKVMLDLTGGLGVDDFAFAAVFREVVSVDKDAELNKLVRKNFEKLHITNVTRVDADAYDFITPDRHYDLVYVDADRRPDTKGRKVYGMAQSEPDVLKIMKRLLEISDRVMLKLSPMADITAIIKELDGVCDIHVVSESNEVKEILVLLSREKTDITIHAVDISGAALRSYKNTRKRDTATPYSDEGKYFYEPALSLIKSGLTVDYAGSQKIMMLSKTSQYMVSDSPVKDFFGRAFIVVAKLEFTKSAVKGYIQLTGMVSANIARRNFPADVDELRKILELKDGGEDYLFFTQNNKGSKLMFHCRKTG